MPRSIPRSRCHSGAGPLSGVRVVELATLLPGPFCGLILSEMGADVTKVEPPGGDPARTYPPRGQTSVCAAREKAGAGALFLALNRGKRCVTLDLKRTLDRAAFLRFASKADVVIEGSRPGTARRLGVDYPTLRRRNPRLVYASISGYGQSGPRAERPGHDLTYQAWAGLLGATGPARRPAMPSLQIADLVGGAFPATIAILAALLERERTGKGRYLDVSMADGARVLTILHQARFAATGRASGADDLLSGRYPCYRVYATRDGHVAVGALEPKFWEEFCRTIGARDLIPHGLGGPSVVRRVEALLRGRTTREWMRRFDLAETCVEPVRGMEEVFSDPDLARRRLLVRDETGPGALRFLRALPAWRGDGRT